MNRCWIRCRRLAAHGPEAEELAEVERREREIESGQVKPLSESEFWKLTNADRKR